MSTAFYKSVRKPEIIASFTHHHKTVFVFTTPCIVNNFGKNQDETRCDTLINPSNPQLSGVQNFPYFPRGGPVPKLKPKQMHKDWQPLGYVSNWGGMEVGEGMLYPASVVDGLVHQLGGHKLALECKMINLFKGGCPVGTAVETSPGNEALKKHYDRIIHVTPPFFKYHESNENPIDILHQCYRKALDLAFQNKNQKVACPIIGAGARGFPYDIAINVAVNESRKWLSDSMDQRGDGDSLDLLFGIPDKNIANLFAQELHDLEDHSNDTT